MLLWLAVIGVLILQETTLTIIIMTLAYQRDHYNLVYTTIIFLVTTLLEIPICSSNKFQEWLKSNWLIKFLKQFRVVSKAVKFSQYLIDRINSIVGIREKIFFLFYLSATVSPAWMNAMISPWLNLNTRQIFFPVLLGVTFWYLSILITLTTVTSFFSDTKIAMTIMIGISIILLVIQKIRIKNKIDKTS